MTLLSRTLTTLVGEFTLTAGELIEAGFAIEAGSVRTEPPANLLALPIWFQVLMNPSPSMLVAPWLRMDSPDAIAIGVTPLEPNKAAEIESDSPVPGPEITPEGETEPWPWPTPDAPSAYLRLAAPFLKDIPKMLVIRGPVLEAFPAAEENREVIAVPAPEAAPPPKILGRMFIRLLLRLLMPLVNVPPRSEKKLEL